ncbi:TPR domain protein [Pleomassaria siparia CBS 279.74]|uniref:TPR domain protein n=1 Tax=Pleomassaria siparia CBS 279.74 TaxID=1314801 RepID=A0A6G1JRW7_9PLEO|nr:TPR domain protein [Pleomassaria siparia CBS 279.74]
MGAKSTLNEHTNGHVQEKKTHNGHTEDDDDDKTAAAAAAPDSRHLIQVRKTSDAGLGVFAMAHIPQSTRILSTPLLLELDGGEDPQELLRAFNKLSDADKASYLELHPFASSVRKDIVKKKTGKHWQHLSEAERNVISIYDANSFEVGVYHLPSRINHSCIPNVHYEYNPAIRRGTFHAVRDIERGEEVLMSYINGGSRIRKWRQPRLDLWGFVCQCAACRNDEEGRKREDRRKEMFDLDQKLAKQSAYGTEMTAMQALKAATKLAGLQLAEGIRNRELRTSYHDAARYCLEIKNVKLALLWAEKELAHEKLCLGEDHPIYQAISARVNLLKDIDSGSTTWDDSMLEYFH